MSIVLYLVGQPGTGKYTIAKEIIKSTDYRLCDNHLINNVVFSLLNYDGYSKIPEYAWDSVRKIRKNIFEFMTKESDNSYIFTNVLYQDNQDSKLYRQVENLAFSRNSIFIPVKLLISIEENASRIQNKERLLLHKSVDPDLIYSKQPLIDISHINLLELDVTGLSASMAANVIIKHIRGKTTP